MMTRLRSLGPDMAGYKWQRTSGLALLGVMAGTGKLGSCAQLRLSMAFFDTGVIYQG